MVYIEDTDELVTGGHGCLQAWTMTHAEVGILIGTGQEQRYFSYSFIRDKNHIIHLLRYQSVAV